MAKFISICFALSVFLTVFGVAGADPNCSREDISRKVERQAAKWERRAQKNANGVADRILAEIEEKLTDDALTECEIKRISAVELDVSTRSNNREKSLPALEYKIANTTPDTNPDWESQITRLSLAYRRLGQFEKLQQLSVDHLPPVEERTTETLEQSLVLALIGLDDPVRAYSLIVEKFNVARSRVKLWDIQIGYALAIRLGREEDADSLKRLADTSFGGLRLPGRLPLIEGDDVDHILARETDPRFEMTVTKNPVPNYPRRAAERRAQADCEVEMDIDTDGKPMNVTAYCSDGLFVSESEAAIKKMRFEPLEIDGEVYVFPSYTYPLEFRIG